MSALIEEARRVEQRMRALEVLAEFVGDLITEPDCPPELRAAWLAYREAIR